MEQRFRRRPTDMEHWPQEYCISTNINTKAFLPPRALTMIPHMHLNRYLAAQGKTSSQVYWVRKLSRRSRLLSFTLIVRLVLSFFINFHFCFLIFHFHFKTMLNSMPLVFNKA